MPEIEIEIINPMGTVAYRRPQGHPDVQEALRTTGYHIRFTIPIGQFIDHGGQENWKLGFRIAGIPAAALNTDEFAFGVNNHTCRMFIWSSWYTPTQLESQRASDWAYNHQPQPERTER